MVVSHQISKLKKEDASKMTIENETVVSESDGHENFAVDSEKRGLEVDTLTACDFMKQILRAIVFLK